MYKNISVSEMAELMVVLLDDANCLTMPQVERLFNRIIDMAGLKFKNFEDLNLDASAAKNYQSTSDFFYEKINHMAITKEEIELRIIQTISSL